MTTKGFIKDNFVLIAGILLPVIIMVLFFVARNLPQTIPEPPQYNMVFSIYSPYERRAKLTNSTLFIEKGTLKVRHSKQRPKDDYPWNQLYIFNAKTKNTHKLPLPQPEGLKEPPSERIEIVEATKDMKIDTNKTSKDGYTLDIGSYRHEPYLRKGMAHIKVTAPYNRDFSHYNIQFLGWVIP